MSQYKVHNSRVFFFSSYVQHTSVLKNKTNNESSAVDSELMVTPPVYSFFCCSASLLVWLPVNHNCLSDLQLCNPCITAQDETFWWTAFSLSEYLRAAKSNTYFKTIFFFWLSIRIVICCSPFFIHRIRHTQSEHMHVFQRIPEKKIIPIK